MHFKKFSSIHSWPCLFLAIFTLSTSSKAFQTGIQPSIVIVGGGTAGSVLAARLCTQFPSVSITVLERGSRCNERSEYLSRSPRFAVQTWDDPSLSEVLLTDPNPAMNNRTIPLVTGSNLGGSSSVNGMQWTVPPFSSVLKWNILGLSSRSLASRYYRRAFRKLEISKPPQHFKQVHVEKYINASENAGFSFTDSPYNEELEKSIWHNRLAISPRGRRSDSYTIYGKPAIANECKNNLRVMEGTLVSKLLLRKQPNGTKKVVGVEYIPSQRREGPPGRLFAMLEVIVSAGPFGSPKLLQLSGIGPPKVLKDAGVHVSHDLPVGERFMARPAAYFTSEYDQHRYQLEPSNDKAVVTSKEAEDKWKAGLPSSHGMAFSMVNGASREYGYFIGATNMPTEELGFGKPWVLSICNGNAKPKGLLRIVDDDPSSPLSISPDFLGRHNDFVRLRKCMLHIERIHHHLRETGFVVRHVMPTVDDEFLRSITTTAGHYVGGCAVGTVVEPNLKVRGVEGLRVVDASVLNELPQSAGPLSSVYMLAEYVSDRLVQKYRCRLGNSSTNQTCKVTGW